MRYPCQKNRFIHSLRKLRSFIPAIFLTARQEPYCRMPIPQIPTLSGNKALAHSHPSKNGLKGEPSPSGAMAGNCNRRAVYPLNRKNRPRITSIPFAFLFTHGSPHLAALCGLFYWVWLHLTFAWGKFIPLRQSRPCTVPLKKSPRFRYATGSIFLRKPCLPAPRANILPLSKAKRGVCRNALRINFFINNSNTIQDGIKKSKRGRLTRNSRA